MVSVGDPQLDRLIAQTQQQQQLQVGFFNAYQYIPKAKYIFLICVYILLADTKRYYTLNKSFDVTCVS